MGEQGGDQSSCCWMPPTPYRPILTRPETKLRPEISTSSRPLGVEEIQENRLVIDLDPDPAEESGFVYHGAGVGAGSGVETSTDAYFRRVAQWRDVPCKELMILAVASANDGSGSAVLGDTQHEFSFPDNHPYDLNIPPPTTNGQFAPITPDKSMRVDSEQMYRIPSSNADDGQGQEIEEQWDANSATINIIDLENNKDIEKSAVDSSQATFSTQLQEHCNPDKEVNISIDLNKTPQPKQRRRKHRPKVIIEGKPKRNTQPSVSMENPKPKRKYVRKSTLNKSTTPPPQESTEHIDSNNLQPTKRSCRKALNFDAEEPRDGSSSSKSLHVGSQSQEMNVGTNGVQTNSTAPHRNEVELVADNTQAGIAQDLIRSTSRMLKHYLSLPDQQPPSTPQQTRGSTTYVDSQKEAAEEVGQMSTHSGYTAQTMLDRDTRSSQRSANDSTHSTTTVLTIEEQAKRSKRNYSSAVEQEDPRTRNLYGANYNNLPAYYNVMSWVHFPYIYKKKRTDKVQNSTIPSTSYHVNMAENIWRPSAAGCLTPGPQVNAGNVSTALEEVGNNPQDRPQSVHSFLPLYQTERSTKRRSSCPTRVRNLASLTRTPEHILHRTCLANQPPTDGNGQRVNQFDRSQTCIDALVTDVGATLAKRKRTKRNPLSSSQRGLLIYKNQPYFATASGVPPQVPFEQLLSAITEHFKCLDINRENSSRFAYHRYNVKSSYKAQDQEHNALVLYRRDGTVVPFDGSFDPIKKRKARPKVDLDQETDRVWKLLLENINSEGINGTDEEKEKWWEQERKVFRGRADNFISRMHLVQGDRRFSPWKGSVVDSVVGVFLTQNVSDHLSSSAFMSMAAHFPLKSRSNEISCDEEVASLVVDEPEVCISENSNQPGCDWSSLTFHDAEHSEEKVVNGHNNSGSTTEGVISTNEAQCKLSHPSEPGPGMYPNSLMNRSTTKITRTELYLQEDMRTYNGVSSQNSVDSSTSQTVEKTGSCESNSETENPPNRCENSSLDHSTSFVELLQRAESSMLHYSLGSTHMSSHDISNCGGYQPACVQHNDQRCEINREASLEPSSNCCLNLTPNPGVQQVEYFDLYGEVTQSSYASKNKCEDSPSERSALTSESPSQDTTHNKLTVNVQEAPRCSGNSCNNIQVGNNMAQSQLGLAGSSNNVDIHSQEQNSKIQQSCLNISGGTTDVMQKATELGSNEQSNSVNKEFSSTNAATSNTKNRKAGKEKKDQQDWDKLRKQAELNGKKREKTENTMDSLDWEAVRCADVNEIAQTIKERGMNNMLAERIKDFLNRLVREHGSVDLEWLRDVPPDQAKEYLLSFRGLGLKSVECVRLLTLHHLAFPVDTNVGRIAVRLGWVPLQPLPESLQLHLLELYPVLESIQKYLWPRLCKLDQRTLYELHYQMITFGKVFCTKSKPNCNACPLRTDCRHFASAFASARLALPGPEEQSIVSATEDRTTHPNPAGVNNRMPLPFPQATYQQLEASQKSEVKSTFGHCEPTTFQQLEASQISDAKSAVGKCEPIIEEPASPEPVCTQISEDIEDFCEGPDEIPTIKLNIEEFTQTLQNYMEKNMELQEGEMSKALVSLTSEAASLPTPKLKNVSRLRTEHQVYELPDTHPLLEMLHMDKREPDDPCNYLLAIWTPGETPNSIQPPEKRCSSQELGKLCDDMECFSCNSAREANSQTVRGTLLIPCRTAMRGSFPLNGTYFQVNEVFADHDSSINPIDVPRAWLWKLYRRTVYFGTSIPTIFKGLSTPEIQHCFWRGFVCVRGFDQKTRAPRPLMARLHFPASKLVKTKDKREE
ncbi:hypothetical protein ACFX2J_008381 [Malus domestica]|nr:DNA glycosylase/AP lyase ROS1 isoform X1 [Malus domestica]XP_028946123.1 DNA glycosylase/AP lyase ROS1 isoform X1 [Malus domestica]